MSNNRLGIYLGVGLIAFASACGGSSTPGSEQRPATATVTVTADAADPAGTSGTGDVGLSADALTTAEQVNTAFYKQRYDWMNSGFTEEQLASDDYWDLSREEFVEKYGAPLDVTYVQQLFVPDWSANPNLVDFIDELKEQHRFVMTIAYITSDAEYDDEPFQQGVELTSAETVLDEQATKKVSSAWVVTNNTDKNRGEELIEGGSRAGETGRSTITWVLAQGRWLISDVQQ